MDIIAPSGKFWIAIPSDKASALVAVICAFSARNLHTLHQLPYLQGYYVM